MLAVYQKAFLETAIATGALKFGDFTLKSGRKSPYFFDAGAFYTGKALTVLAQSYAAIVADLHNKQPIEALYGPAYKGIPLVAAVAVVLQLEYGISLPWAFNRKEVKNHGEGGILVGAPLSGKKVLIIDDVLTAGTAVKEALTILYKAQAIPTAVIVALDRQEKVNEQHGALSLLQTEEKLTATAVVTLDDLLFFVQNDGAFSAHLSALQAYRANYGVKYSG